MEFTYEAYDGLIKKILKNNYVITDYFEYKKIDKIEMEKINETE